MANTIEQRACELAVYITENNATVRKAANHFGISKSTVHKDISQRSTLHYCPKYPGGKQSNAPYSRWIGNKGKILQNQAKRSLILHGIHGMLM